MNASKSLLLFVSAFLCLHHTASFGFGSKMAGTMASDDTGRFKIAGNMSSAQQQLLVDDLRFLQSARFENVDSDLNALLHVQASNGAAMESWLADRVQYVVGENLQLDKSVLIVREGYEFENPGVLPDRDEATSSGSIGSIIDWLLPKKDSVVIVMQNLGAALYSLGKEHNSLLGFKVPSGDIIAISSPRTGVIQVGEGLFQNHDSDSKKLDTKRNRLFRLATFFHEAHHSDGNGKTLSFEHAMCPDGHLYAGYHACDRNLNGPYTVGAMVTRYFSKNCSECSLKEIEEMQLDALDSFSRVIVNAAAEPTMEFAESAQMESEECQYILAHPELKISASAKAKVCIIADAADAQALQKSSTPSTYWDEQPEGSR